VYVGGYWLAAGAGTSFNITTESIDVFAVGG
jgi:hypothetical protein